MRSGCDSNVDDFSDTIALGGGMVSHSNIYTVVSLWRTWYILVRGAQPNPHAKHLYRGGENVLSELLSELLAELLPGIKHTLIDALPPETCRVRPVI